MDEKPIICWDVDGTLISHVEPGKPIPPPKEREIRPYAVEVIRTLESLGVENYIWSRAGEDNACATADLLGIPRERCLAKPELDDPEKIKGSFTPDIVVDDNPDETVLVYPHVLVQTYKGGVEDKALLSALTEIRAFLDALEKDTPGSLEEIKVRFKRKRRTPLRVKMKRRRYYRRRKAYYKRYKKRWKRKPKTKRLMRIRKRLQKQFGKKLRRFRMRIVI